MGTRREPRGADPRDLLPGLHELPTTDGHVSIVVVRRDHAVRVADHDDVAASVAPPASIDDGPRGDRADARTEWGRDVDCRMGRREAVRDRSSDRQRPEMSAAAARLARDSHLGRGRLRWLPGRFLPRRRPRRRHRAATRDKNPLACHESPRVDGWAPLKDRSELDTVPGRHLPERVASANNVNRPRRRRRLGGGQGCGRASRLTDPFRVARGRRGRDRRRFRRARGRNDDGAERVGWDHHLRRGRTGFGCSAATPERVDPDCRECCQGQESTSDSEEQVQWGILLRADGGPSGDGVRPLQGLVGGRASRRSRLNPRSETRLRVA